MRGSRCPGEPCPGCEVLQPATRKPTASAATASSATALASPALTRLPANLPAARARLLRRSGLPRGVRVILRNSVLRLPVFCSGEEPP